METITQSSPYQTQFEEFLNTKYRSELERLASVYPDEKSIAIGYNVLEEYDTDLADELIQNPYPIIKAAQDAISQANFVNPRGEKVRLNVRFVGFPEDSKTLIRSVDSAHIGKFLSVDGVVTTVTESRPKVVNAVFECRHCGRVYNIPQTDKTGKFSEPAGCACERKNFQLLLEQCTFIDTQRAEIQEPLELLRGGEQAKKMELWIEDDLTNRIVPGDKVEMTGILNLHNPKGRGAIYDKFLDINSITQVQKEFENIKFTEEEENKIKELANDPKIYDKIVASIAPSIYGHSEIKEAIALQLLGGTQGKIKADGMKIRSDMHILLIGDPGCLVADERVVLGNGVIAKIGDLGKEHLEEIDVPLLTGQGYKRDKATVFHVYKNQPIMEIVTETGKSIKGTYNHPLLVIKNRERFWKRLDEIRPGDKVASVPWIPCTVTAYVKTGWKKLARRYGPKVRSKLPEQMDESLAGLMGYVLVGGWVRDHRVGMLVNSHELDILPKLVSAIEKNFGVRPSVRKKRLQAGRKIELTEIDLNDADVAYSLSFLKDKRVPDLIFKSGNTVVAEFLSWLFEADGCVFSRGRGRRAVQLKSSSIELLRDVQVLLLRFGIHSRIVERNLTIRRAESIKKFSGFIGFKSQKKKERLERLVEDCKHLREQNLRGKQLSEKVIRVAKAGCADVFDVEIPKSHRFIANGIISHNTAKTQLLIYVNQLAPKGVYVSGKSSSAAGLTATAEKDDSTDGRWTLKAGALVLAAGGMASIDEFDKMNEEDSSAMHEAMESQVIHITKAGIHAMFKANTAILAAANPIYGRFDPNESPAAQFDIPPTLISRFDLIFPIKDELDEAKDREMVKHILTSHFTAGVKARGNYDKEEMKKAEERVLPAIEPDLLRNYIAYARKEIKPLLTKEAMDKIEAFYVDLRKIGQKQKSVPITPRYLEAIIRLAEASAKGRLSDTVDLEDADRAIRLMKFCLSGVGVDPETGKFDIDIIAVGTSRSKQDRLKIVYRAVKAQSEGAEGATHEALLEEAKTQGLRGEEFEEALSSLLRNGDVYKPRHGIYRPADEKG